jgi:hypothetical protein
MSAEFARKLVTLATVGVVLLWGASVFSQENTESPGSLALAEELVPQVEAIRGWKFKHPVEKFLYSEEQLRDYVLEMLEKEYPEEEVRLSEAFLHLIGALPDSLRLKETLIEVLISQIGGFYDPSTRAFYMIEREGVQYGEVVEKIMIAHELTHALDDQYVSLDSLLQARERTEDGEFVVSSLVEGSATALMTTYVTKSQLAGELDPSDLMKVMKSEKERSAVFFEAPIYFQTLVACYYCGMGFLLEGNLAGMMAGGEKVGENFLAAVSDPPRSSEQILHPEKYWTEDRDEPVVVNDEDVIALLASHGHDVVGKNTAGEILMGVVTTDQDREFNSMASGLSAYWTNKASMGWGGDRFYLGESDRGWAGLWFTLWDTPKDRDEFAATYSTEVLDTSRNWFPLGERGAVFLFGLDEEPAGAIEKALLETPPGFTKNGEIWTP